MRALRLEGVFELVVLFPEVKLNISDGASSFSPTTIISPHSTIIERIEENPGSVGSIISASELQYDDA